MIRIYADFNNGDEKEGGDRVALDCPGSLVDLEEQADHLGVGERIILYVPGEFEVEAVLEFDRIWWARPSWSSISYA